MKKTTYLKLIASTSFLLASASNVNAAAIAQATHLWDTLSISVNGSDVTDTLSLINPYHSLTINYSIDNVPAAAIDPPDPAITDFSTPFSASANDIAYMLSASANLPH